MANGSSSRKKAAVGAEAAPTISQEEIAKVAYELYQQRGCTPGGDQQDWLEAERLLRQQRRRSSTH